jgi:DNA-binding XRE family transcriptional regulator
MAQSQNTHIRDIYDGTLVYAPDLTGTDVVNQGDIVVFDATLNGGLGGVRSAVAQADLAKYIGVATQNSVINSLNDKQTTIIVAFKNVFIFNTTAGDVYTHLAPVYFNETATGAQTVTVGTNSGARSVKVGYVVLPQELVMNGTLSITGAAGVVVQVAVAATYPIVGLA